MVDGAGKVIEQLLGVSEVGLVVGAVVELFNRV